MYGREGGREAVVYSTELVFTRGGEKEEEEKEGGGGVGVGIGNNS